MFASPRAYRLERISWHGSSQSAPLDSVTRDLAVSPAQIILLPGGTPRRAGAKRVCQRGRGTAGRGEEECAIDMARYIRRRARRAARCQCRNTPLPTSNSVPCPAKLSSWFVSPVRPSVMFGTVHIRHATVALRGVVGPPPRCVPATISGWRAVAASWPSRESWELAPSINNACLSVPHPPLLNPALLLLPSLLFQPLRHRLVQSTPSSPFSTPALPPSPALVVGSLRQRFGCKKRSSPWDSFA